MTAWCPHRSQGWLALGGAALLTWLACAQPPTEPPAEASLPASPPTELATVRPGTVQRVPLGPGDRAWAALDLTAGDWLDLVVEQHEVDVEVRLLGPDGALLVRVDGLLQHTGPEWLRTLVGETGRHRLEIEAVDATCSGEVVVRLETLRPATATDPRRLEAEQAFRVGEASLTQDSEAAVVAYGQALEHFQALGDALAVATNHHRLGMSFRLARKLEQALHHFDLAVTQAEALDDPLLRMMSHSGRGGLLLDQDRGAEAWEDYEIVVAMGEALGDRRQQGLALRHMAQIAQRSGRLQQALDLYRRGLDHLKPCDGKDWLGAQHNLGVLLTHGLGQPERALRHFEVAERGYRARGEMRHRSISLNQWGQALQALGDFAGARQHLAAGLALRQDRYDQEVAAGRQPSPCKLANSQAKLAMLAQDAGEPEQARQRIGLTPSLLGPGTDCPKERPTVALSEAQILLAQERWGAAESAFSRALELYERRDDPSRIAQSLAGRAKARWAIGRFAAAQPDITRGLELIEGVRASVVRNDLQMSYFANAQALYGLAVELAMTAGEWEQGLVLAEQARARALRDRWRILDEAESSEPEDGAGSESYRERRILQSRRDRLVDQLNLVVYRARRSSTSDEERTVLQRRAEQLEAQVLEIEGDLRRLDPRSAVLLRQEPVEVTTLQQSLDDGTVLVELFLGESRSFLWLLTHDGLEAHVLPPRAELETLARAAHEVLRRPGIKPWDPRPLCDLSTQLLDPLAGRWTGSRLVVALDGTLNALPVAALPDPAEPCEIAQPMLTRHEVVTVPSAALLPLLGVSRHEATDGGAPWVGIVADPVYDGDDPRLTAAMSPAGAERSRGWDDDPADRWARLPGTGEEAEAILRSAAPGRGVMVRGLDAARSMLLGREETASPSAALALHRARVLHVATHGVFDPERPLRSHLVLAQRDRDGRPLDGRVYAHEIANLRLDAELAVLSVCRSGQGRSVPGEGSVGLARGFWQAGVERVLVSLWDVGDLATVPLMDRFYAELFDQANPAAALRSAQLERWQAGCPPATWAGFTLQGDWRPMTPFNP